MADLQTKDTRRGTGHPTDVAEGEVRARIISEAARIFSESGYSGASIQDIVDAAGTTKPMVYYYFENKEGLYQEIFRTFHDFLNRAQEEILGRQDLSTRDKLVMLVDVHFQAARTAPEQARFMFAAHFGPRREMPAVKDPEHEDAFFGTLVALAKEGIAGGELEGDPVMIAQALLGQILIHLTFHIAAPNQIPLAEDAADRVVDQLLTGVGKTKGV